jgi:hypothetical protein
MLLGHSLPIYYPDLDRRAVKDLQKSCIRLAANRLCYCSQAVYRRPSNSNNFIRSGHRRSSLLVALIAGSTGMDGGELGSGGSVGLIRAVGHEAGGLSPWLHRELQALGLPMVLLETPRYGASQQDRQRRCFWICPSWFVRAGTASPGLPAGASILSPYGNGPPAD